jgi:hypothetical protein
MENLPNGPQRPSRGGGVIFAGGDVNGVTVVKETIGMFFLGILAIALLIALQRAQARNRELLVQLGQRDQSPT